MSLNEDELHANLIENATGVDIRERKAENFDDDEQSTKSKLDFEQLLSGLAQNTKNQHLQTKLKTRWILELVPEFFFINGSAFYFGNMLVDL